MAKLLFQCLGLLAAVLVFPVSSSLHSGLRKLGGVEKKPVCHSANAKEYVLITVGEPGYNNHIRKHPNDRNPGEDIPTKAGFIFGNNCEEIPKPIHPGACCRSGGRACKDSLTPESCSNAGGTYQGEGVLCENILCTSPPPTGACCIDGSCQETDQVDCGGDYQGDGSTCGDSTCVPPPTGACCRADDTCEEVTQTDCGDAYRGDGSFCNETDCSTPPTGACCNTQGTCEVTTASLCGDGYQGDGIPCTDTTCSPSPTGACCADDSTCSDAVEANCAGTWTEAACNEVTCPSISGACCFSDGTCSDTQENLCTGRGGDYRGANTLCDSTTCPAITGACCSEDPSCFDCTISTQTNCTIIGGSYQGDNSICPLLGACRCGDTCVVNARIECVSSGRDECTWFPGQPCLGP